MKSVSARAVVVTVYQKTIRQPQGFGVETNRKGAKNAKKEKGKPFALFAPSR